MTDIQKYIEMYWISIIGNKSNNQYEKAIDAFGSIHNAWTFTENENYPGNGIVEENFLIKLKNKVLREKAKTDVEKAMREGVGIVSIEDNEYPVMLTDYKYRPLVMFYIGDLKRLGTCEKSLGVVGSRNSTATGRDITKRLIEGLRGKNIAVISGMARGIDATAHIAALENDLFTVAVLGCGPDFVYPSENRPIYNKIKEKGLILSEHPPGTTPTKQYFPARNRIIAGLSDAILVTEAGKKSGAMITVDLALDAGRDILSVPQSVDSMYGAGCNELLKNSAACITESADVLLALGYNVDSCNPEEFDPGILTEEQRTVYNIVLSSGGVNEDEITERSYLDVVSVKRALGFLELMRIIRLRDDGEYVPQVK